MHLFGLLSAGVLARWFFARHSSSLEIELRTSTRQNPCHGEAAGVNAVTLK
jgi:hypothetical protein